MTCAIHTVLQFPTSIGMFQQHPHAANIVYKQKNTSPSAAPAAKTPLMLIMEGATRVGCTCVFELCSDGDTVDAHGRPLFTYRVILRNKDGAARPDDPTVVGQPASSKRVAKVRFVDCVDLMVALDLFSTVLPRLC